MEAGSARITAINRIILTISKHVIAQAALTGRKQRVCVDESAQFRIVIAGLEIVERGLSVLGVAVGPFCPQQGTVRFFAGDKSFISVSWD